MATSLTCACLPANEQVQTIGFLSQLRSHKIYGPFIVIGPLSTLPNWVSEFQRWCPDQPALLYHGNKQERADLRQKHLSGVLSSNSQRSFCRTYSLQGLYSAVAVPMFLLSR